MPNAVKRELAALRFERRYEEEVAIALSALDCALLGRRGVYASSELTTGRRAQRLQREHNLPDPAALRDGLGAERYRTLLWSPNVGAAVAFADELRSLLGGAELVISPAPFDAPGWPQTAYLAFWDKVIRTRVTAVYLNDGWHFSNGCVHEFTVASEQHLPTFNRQAQPISVKDGIGLVSQAVGELESHGLHAGAIRVSLEQLKRVDQGVR